MKKRVILNIELLSLILLFVDEELIGVFCHHADKVWRSFILLRDNPSEIFFYVLHLNPMGLPNFEDWTPVSSFLFYDLLDGITPHAERYADSFLLVGDPHYHYAFFLLLAFRFPPTF